MSKFALDLIQQAKREGWKSLDLGHTGLTDDNIPDELYELTELEELWLCNQEWDYEKERWKESPNMGIRNALNKIPSSIVKLKKLRCLNIGRGHSNECNISDIAILKNLKNIEYLNLTNNQQIKDFSILEELKNLQYLYLSDDISDISFLKNLEGLQALYISSNKKINDFRVIKNLKNIKTLDISYNDISDISFLKELENLRSLNLALLKTQ